MTTVDPAPALPGRPAAGDGGLEGRRRCGNGTGDGVADTISLVSTAPHVCRVQLPAGAGKESSSAAESATRSVAPTVASDEDSDGCGRCRGACASRVATSATSSANCVCREKSSPAFSSDPTSRCTRCVKAGYAVGGWADHSRGGRNQR